MPLTHTISYSDIDKYCDSLERIGTVQIILIANRAAGYSLWIENNQDILKVVDDRGEQIRFRTVDQTLDELINISYLSDLVFVDRTHW